MRRSFPVATAIAAILGAGVFLGACAQTRLSSTASPHEVEGRIVDVRGPRLLLHDGTALLIPGPMARWSELSLGAVVRVQYEEVDGQKVATSMVFREGAEGQRGM
jgi:hypothetical protein